VFALALTTQNENLNTENILTKTSERNEILELQRNDFAVSNCGLVEENAPEMNIHIRSKLHIIQQWLKPLLAQDLDLNKIAYAGEHRID